MYFHPFAEYTGWWRMALETNTAVQNCGPPAETEHTVKQLFQHRPGKLAGTQSQEWLQPEGELKCVAALNKVHKKSKNGCKSRGTRPRERKVESAEEHS